HLPGTSTPHSTGAPNAAGGSPHVTGSTAGGLPKRRRRQPASGQQRHPRPAAPMPPTDIPPERSAEETARRMGAFARGTRSGRTGEHQMPPLPGDRDARPGDRDARPAGRVPGPGPMPEQLPPFAPPGPPADAHAPTPVEDEGNPHA
ncbi:hypothetical protein K6I33_005701, partial [Streptomyces sp. UNOB3_S3]|nr:hypothetical protein [Streptomyces sp. UNOB3_S3]